MSDRPEIVLTIQPPNSPSYEAVVATDRQRFVIGRQIGGKTGHRSVDLGIADPHVSRMHCRITWDAEGWTVTDLNSSNGTQLNGNELREPTPLRDRDRLLIGTTLIVAAMRVTEGAEPASAAELPPEPPRDGDDGATMSADDDSTMIGGSDETWVADATLVASAADADAHDDAAAIAEIVDAAEIADADATLVASAAEIAEIVDAAEIADADATLVASADDADADAGATLVAAAEIAENADVDATLVASAADADAAEDEGATLVAAAAADADAAADAGATLVAAADDEDADADATVVADAAAAELARAEAAALIAQSRTLVPGGSSPPEAPEGRAAAASPASNWVAPPAVTTRSAAELNPAVATGGDEVARPAAEPAPEGDIRLPRLVRHLVDNNLLDIHKAETLVEGARAAGRTVFGALAEDLGIRFKDEIRTVVAEKTGVPTISVEAELRDKVYEARWLSPETASDMGVVPLLSSDPTEFRYGTVDPFDITVRDWVFQFARRADPRIERVQPVLLGEEFLAVAFQRLKAVGEAEESGDVGVAIDITEEEDYRMSAQLDNQDVPSIVNFFIHRAFTQGASDIHVEPTEAMMLVRNRVDGILHEDSSLPMALHPEVASRIKIMSGMDVAEKRRPQDGRIGSVVRGNPLDVRVSTYPTVYGEKVVMRLLDKNALRPSVQAIGLLPRDLARLTDKINAPFGLIMISGPTGSGKTTTLYSCLSSIDKRVKNVLTIEDPVEYRLAGVHQMQVNDKIGLTFAAGLRTILRQDPDVIMVGECRDVETAGMAIQAALTGHIVFSTIHTNDSVGVITRLLDMKIDPFLVANAVSVAIAQRLVRRICPRCRVETPGSVVLRALEADGVSEERLLKLGVEIDPDVGYVRGGGCLHCRNTGYQGRQPVFEMFEMSNDARAVVMSGFNADKLREMARRQGMMTLIEHGLRLVEEGITTHEEVIRVLGETA